jgi:hypothetical protein
VKLRYRYESGLTEADVVDRVPEREVAPWLWDGNHRLDVPEKVLLAILLKGKDGFSREARATITSCC